MLPQPYNGQAAGAFPARGAGEAVPQTLFGTPGHGYQPLSEQAYTTNAETGTDDDDDDGTDTDTSSDDWTEDIQLPEIAHMPEQEAAEHIYWMYRRAKRIWRRFTGKPVRRFRRAIKLQKRRRGKGKGKGRYFLLFFKPGSSCKLIRSFLVKKRLKIDQLLWTNFLVNWFLDCLIIFNKFLYQTNVCPRFTLS
jgi:hypothetical protein